MTLGPTRLKHDPDFQWETGCNVADEELVLSTVDHTALRARIVAAALATGAAATTTAVLIGDGVPAVARAAGWTFAVGWKPVVVATAGAAMLAGAYWFDLQSHSAPMQEPMQEGGSQMRAPIVAPAILETDIGSADLPVRQEDVSGSPTASLRTGSPVAAIPDTLNETEPVPADATMNGLAPAPPGSAPTPPSALMEENNLQEIAAEALDDGNWARAEQLYERYLAEYPNGRMIPEAMFGLLEARFARGDAAGAEQLAKKMQGDPRFSDKHEEILRFWAESLVQLNRCGEALLVAEKLAARSDAAPVRRACRH